MGVSVTDSNRRVWTRTHGGRRVGSDLRARHDPGGNPESIPGHTSDCGKCDTTECGSWTVVPEISESDKPVAPVEMYAMILGSVHSARDRGYFHDGLFLRPAPERVVRTDMGMLQR
jgi:hypothetical protein